MLPDPFMKALAFTLRWEGGFVDNPDDRGGRTNTGITQATYDAYRKLRRLPPADVLHITEDEVRFIYRTQYWDVWKSWGVTGDLQTAVFDTCVNLGVRRTGTWLKVTGKDTKALLTMRLNAYLRYADVPSQTAFLPGWENRLNALCALVNIDLNSGKVNRGKYPHL